MDYLEKAKELIEESVHISGTTENDYSEFIASSREKHTSIIAFAVVAIAEHLQISMRDTDAIMDLVDLQIEEISNRLNQMSINANKADGRLNFVIELQKEFSARLDEFERKIDDISNALEINSVATLAAADIAKMQNERIDELERKRELDAERLDKIESSGFAVKERRILIDEIENLHRLRNEANNEIKATLHKRIDELERKYQASAGSIDLDLGHDAGSEAQKYISGGEFRNQIEALWKRFELSENDHIGLRDRLDDLERGLRGNSDSPGKASDL